jgi:hypothetical protein
MSWLRISSAASWTEALLAMVTGEAVMKSRTVAMGTSLNSRFPEA